MSEADDFLLYALSARVELSYRAFKETFNNLYSKRYGYDLSGHDALERHWRNTLRGLDSLGHCDVIYRDGSNKIVVAPSRLARLPILGLPQAILCGSRGPQTLNLIKEKKGIIVDRIEVESLSQETRSPCIPQRILVTAEDEHAMDVFAQELDIEYLHIPPSWIIASNSGSLEEYTNQLKWSPVTDLDWARGDYDPATLHFNRNLRVVGSVRLSSYRNPQTTLENHFFIDRGQRSAVDLFWGRYLLLSELQIHVIIYDPRKMLMAVPVGAPLPRLLARALALCSGYAPQYMPRAKVQVKSREAFGFDVFSAIPPSLASTVAAKLNQNLVHTNLDF